MIGKTIITSGYDKRIPDDLMIKWSAGAISSDELDLAMRELGAMPFAYLGNYLSPKSTNKSGGAE